MIRRSIAAVVPVVLSVALWGCAGAATPQPAGSAAASTAASEGPPSAAASVAASVAPSSVAAASEPAPGFSLPSEVKALEALLPDTMCGAKSIKVSMNGSSFVQSGAGSDLEDALKSVGKSLNDVQVAFAGASETGCTAGIIRIQGADPNTLKTAMLQAAAKSSAGPVSEKDLGGKHVYVQAGDDAHSYIYFAGDAIIVVAAKTDDDAAAILQDLP
jgi:hypothetical protein